MNFSPAPTTTPTIIFDIGNVLLFYDFDLASEKIFNRKLNDIAPEILTPLKNAQIELEEGQKNDGEFLAIVRDLSKFAGSDAKLALAYQDIFVVNTKITRHLAELKNHARLLLLSNTSNLHLQFIWQKYDFFQHFHGGVFSHLAGAMKPKAAIYQQIISKYQLDLRQTIFYDDLAENVAAARAAGIDTHQYLPSHGLPEFCQKILAF